MARLRHDDGDPESLANDRRGWLWVATRAGLAVSDRGASGLPTFRHYLPDPDDPARLANRSIQDLHEDSAGELWFATRAGVSRYSPERDAFEVYVHDPADPASLSNNVVLRIHESRSGILWFGTFGGGVSSYSRGKHKFAQVARGPAGLADVAVYSILVDRRSTLWVGTQVG